MYQSGLACGMSFDMISSMTAGNLVDYIISYNKLNEKSDKKDGQVREATQADFDAF